MKNPWMSLWLSVANSAASTAWGFWRVEAERQRRAAAKVMAGTIRPSRRSGSATRKAPGQPRGE